MRSDSTTISIFLVDEYDFWYSVFRYHKQMLVKKQLTKICYIYTTYQNVTGVGTIE